MSYRLIKGSFHLFYTGTRHVGSQPDGDSVWFQPANPDLLEDIDGRSADFNKGGFAQLRFEAIDALETHFLGENQDRDYALAARDYTLKSLGFDLAQMEYSGKEYLTVRFAAPHPTEGYILTRAIDPYGRPVSFVFSERTGRKDGSDVFLDVDLFEQSVNAGLAKSGNAFPAFYTGLPTDLRNRVIALIRSARNKRSGLWKDDQTNKGVLASSIAALEESVLFPKLFRRLVNYYKDGIHGLGKFETWLRADEDRDDTLWIVSKGEQANMHDIIQVNGNKIALCYPPEDIIIVPR